MNLLRPRSTLWFEILAPKIECAKSLGNLGRTAAVEIEVRPHDEELISIHELAEGLEEYHQLAKLFQRYWPVGELHHAPKPYSPVDIMHRALTGIQKWRVAADPVIDELQRLQEERLRLAYCQRFLNGIKESDLDFTLIGSVGPVLSVVSAILPAGIEMNSVAALLSISVSSEEDSCFLALTETKDKQLLHRDIKAINGRVIIRPSWIEGDAKHALSQVDDRVLWLDQHITQHLDQLHNFYEEYGLDDVLGDVACLEWFLDQVGTLEPVGSNLVWITGWTTADNSNQLSDVLSEAGVPALVSFPSPPADVEPPKLLHNPWWAKPFEVFINAFGAPSSHEVDPSPLLAVIVPFLFGYMFADVGQGIILILAGFWLQSRWDGARILVFAGISATLFGFLFGSVFSYENLIPALLFHPLHNPLLVLSLPLLFGAVLLVLAQLLNGIESFWRGSLVRWLLQDGGLLVLYIGALSSLLKVELGIIALIGAVWFVVGNMLVSCRWYMLFGALGKLLEDGVRLLVNTVSFMRVGAFALAHAGLSSALVLLSESSSSVLGSILIILFGNALIIVLEGLIVSIQTTRLVLFEFFVRFFQGAGRPFRPLIPPPNIINVPPHNV
ncbi:MAG: ATPase [Gammaproteobacteria bacterium]|nr:ATPase [Gammaproteobacteria bacterium]